LLGFVVVGDAVVEDVTPVLLHCPEVLRLFSRGVSPKYAAFAVKHGPNGGAAAEREKGDDRKSFHGVLS
jgi:hypothetical protein